MGFRYGFKADANRIALKVRQKMGLRPTDPIRPHEVCSHYDIELQKLSDIGCDTSHFLGDGKEEFSAVIVSRGLRTSIIFNDSHSEYRQNSNICHELGHCFLGHEQTPPLTPAGERIRDGGIEAEANWLAGTLLLTNEGALYVLQRGLRAKAQEIYGISKAMLDWRLKVSGAYIRYKRMN